MKPAYLITGATGFLGKELNKAFCRHAVIDMLGRSRKNHIVCDLSSDTPQIDKAYDIVIHNAGKAHVVPKTASDAEEFFQVNYHGTLNLLKSFEASHNLPKALILISTVAVYGLENGALIDESCPLNASDPYGLSKSMAEEAVFKWGKKNEIPTGILRLPLVAGPLPPGNLHKMIKAQQTGYFFHIGQGDTRRSMVSASDVAAIIPKLAEVGGVYNLTDQYHPSFAELTSLFSKKLGLKDPYHVPFWVARSLAKIGDFYSFVLRRDAPFSSNSLSKMTSSLTFSDEKAKRLLNWQPQRVLHFFESLPKEDLVYD
ncbi:MAG: NAD-dependent epimerase/dehydratase family protein [Roseivirga sp.]|nr:NAD-dependent epimerase/dehydratase family protein [Roseivirga sp.]